MIRQVFYQLFFLKGQNAMVRPSSVP